MSERYYITGVQLGMLIALSKDEEMQNLLGFIEENQFIENVDVCSTFCEDCGQKLDDYERNARWCLPCYDTKHKGEESTDSEIESQMKRDYNKLHNGTCECVECLPSIKKGCGAWIKESDDYGWINCGDRLSENEETNPSKVELCNKCRKLNKSEVNSPSQQTSVDKREIGTIKEISDVGENPILDTIHSQNKELMDKDYSITTKNAEVKHG